MNNRGIYLTTNDILEPISSITTTVGDLALTNRPEIVSLNGTTIIHYPAYTVPNSVQIYGGAVTCSIVSGNNTYTGVVNALTTVQLQAFSATYTANFIGTLVPYYQTTGLAIINGTSTNGVFTATSGSIGDGTNTASLNTSQSNTTSVSIAPSQTLSFASTVLNLNVTGTGTGGAGSSTLTLATNVPITAPPTYTPAFYLQTSNSTIPTFTTSTTQTTGAASGATVTFPVASASTQYDWIAVDATIPLNKLMFVSTFGNSQLVPTVTGTKIIAGKTFSVYGITGLDTSNGVQIYIAP